ncbi:hypothetical protein ACJ6WD_40995 [Streptomyces sp. VTCC 41912]|uniref:hypothetical protein n=1 Tax=Streptomyces sp. VTCC 41912 TaxID=3383243 RepID=UPI003896AE6A
MAATLCENCDEALCVLCRAVPVEQVGDQCERCAYEPPGFDSFDSWRDEEDDEEAKVIQFHPRESSLGVARKK